ncbi:MAG: hypothetical protein JSW20_04060 [Nitrospiraceae bacterium]|nr:MAG: hypothetical protein JSW20_04060 [Nitrospiraceae bacterium]
MPRSHALELSGYAAVEGRLFTDDPLYPEQERHVISLAIEPELYHKWEGGPSFIFTPFIRADSADPERSHVDIRELNYVWISDTWELKVGISKVFWGVTEFVHLVDIINQTDFVENIDGEDKLGQPMVHVSIPRNWGVLDFFMLPYFRERTFPGEKGRNRTQLIVDTDRSVFESSDEENHIDFALRYNHTLGDWDFGIYHFNGTGREPSFTLGFDPGGLVLVPKYWLIEQTGLDVQAVKGNLLLKLESLYRSGQGDSFYALVGGLEYSFYNVVSRGVDIGLIVEWAYDDRDEDVSVVFNNDLMTGVRLALNDVSGTEVLAGFIIDLDNSDRVLTIESSRRLRDNIKIVVDAYVVLQSSEDSLIHAIRNDNNIRIELVRYF